MATLYIMKGFPGSGKSTRAKEIAEETGAIITSLDSMREEIAGSRKNWHSNRDIFGDIDSSIAKIQYAIIKFNLSNGNDVIVDNMNIKVDYVNILRKIAKKYDAEVEVVTMFANLDTLLERNKSRPEDERVDEEWLKKLYNNFKFEFNWGIKKNEPIRKNARK